MGLASIISSVLLMLGVSSGQDVVGSTGCSMPTCVFSNAHLRFGTGAETSVNQWGLFNQPWYFSNTSNLWYKLTFSNYPLDTAIGLGYGGQHWSGVNIMNLYSLTATNAVTDYSEYVVSGGDTTKTIGYGKIVSTRVFNVFSNNMVIQNTFVLGQNASFVKIITRVINNSTAVIPNVIIWTGTRDDFVGMTDVNTKTRGNLNTGSFVPITRNNQSSYAIMITNTDEGVLFYSETPGVMTAYALCCAFSNVYNTNPLTLAPMTPTPTDGSYALVLPVGNLSVTGSASITWYYAAGAVSNLNAVAENVAANQVADAPSPSPSGTGSGSGSGSGTGTGSATGSGTSSGTRTSSVTPSISALATPIPLGTAHAVADAVAVPTDLITMTWPTFIGYLVLIYIVLNAIFICCCSACINIILHKTMSKCNNCKTYVKRVDMADHMNACTNIFHVRMPR
jgi:uncharacterized membrane protein YgcG